MLRSLLSVVKNVKFSSQLLSSSQHALQRSPAVGKLYNTAVLQQRNICEIKSSLLSNNRPSLLTPSFPSIHRLLQPIPVQPSTSVRTVTKFSRSKGKRKSVALVLKKFYRLNWGIWIRCKAGRNKRLYKKSAHRRRRLQYHVFCNATQSRLLDKMVTKYWRSPKYYVDDVYEPFHAREEFAYTRMKPWEPPL